MDRRQAPDSDRKSDRPSGIALRWIGGAASIAAIGLGLGVAAWPFALKGSAEAKLQAALEQRFDSVELEGVTFKRRSLHVENARLTKGDSRIDVKVDVEHRVGWDFDLYVDEVSIFGEVYGNSVDDFRGIFDSESGGGSDGRVHLGGAKLSANLFLLIDHKEFQYSSFLNIDDQPLAGPYDARVDDPAITGEIIAKADEATLTIDPHELFPLRVEFDDGSFERDGYKLKGADGFISLRDPDLENFSFDIHHQNDWSVDGIIDRKSESAYANIKAKNIAIGDYLSVDGMTFDGGSLEIDAILNTNIIENGKEFRLRGVANVDGLSVQHPMLSRDSIMLSADSIIDVAYRPADRSVFVHGAEVSVGGVEVVGSGSYIPNKSVSIELAMPEQDCQRIFNAVPEGFFPKDFESFKLSGKASAAVRTNIVFGSGDKTTLKGGLNLDGCKLESVPDQVAKLKEGFHHTVRARNGKKYHVGVGPFYSAPPGPGLMCDVRYDEVHPALPGALIAIEDGTFFSHKGFRSAHLIASLKRNVDRGEFRRGGSTLTMQMVKNALLSHEKTLARKMQELFLTWVVEQELSKKRILEIYLSIVEYGPGIYGVCEAADHYFGKSIFQLNAKEAAFLATLMPRPVQRHRHWCNNSLPPEYDMRLERILSRMLKKELISQEEYDEAVGFDIEFDRLDFDGRKNCYAAGDAMLDGEYTQQSLTGFYATP